MICLANLATLRNLIIASTLACSGCSMLHTKTPEGEPVSMNEADFAAYFEHVFRHHNNVVNDSLFVTSDLLTRREDPVSKAEASMDHACQPLNDVAVAVSTGESADFMTKVKLLDAVPECEAATRRLEQLLTKQKK